MPTSKQDLQQSSNASSTEVDHSQTLSDDVARSNVATQLLNPEIFSAFQTSKRFKGIFQPPVDTIKALTCVVQGDVDTLIKLVKNDPNVLFHKRSIRAPRGQEYYNLSPYMLIKFLCDADMLAKVIPFISKTLKKNQQIQDEELGYGGSDLVKLDFDPLLLDGSNFNKILQHEKHIDALGSSTDVKFPLLENPDGILYWKDGNGKVNFYYANRETKSVIPINFEAKTVEAIRALSTFIGSFDSMVANSARRSTNKEHQLIADLTKHILHRQGVLYSVNGEEYCDSRTPFQLMNRYRVCIQLYNKGHTNLAHQYWREGIGKAQGEEMWLLQRICEEDTPFYPPPNDIQDFKRGFAYEYLDSAQRDLAFKKGHLVDGLGKSFSFHKGMAALPLANASEPIASFNLAAVYLHVEAAKAKIIELMQESEPVLQSRVGQPA